MPAFARAVADALLPGDEVLPPASAVGLHAGAHPEALDAVAAAAGGQEGFLAADAAARARAVARAEAAAPAAFRTMLGSLLRGYYGADAVSEALGWRAGPPQPAGHAVAETDAETWRRLDRVRARGRLWR